MKSIKLLSILSLAVLVAGMCLQSSASNTTLSIQITPGVVTYGSPASMTFVSTVSTSFSVQTLAQDFTGVANYFWIQDMKGSDSGYNTTLQLSGNLTAGVNVISGSNISFKAIGSIVTVTGTVNTGVQFDTGTVGYQALNSARTFIFRPVATNNTKIGYYAANINLQANIPASQAAGSYTATMVYTLIEN